MAKGSWAALEKLVLANMGMGEKEMHPFSSPPNALSETRMSIKRGLFFFFFFISKRGALLFLEGVVDTSRGEL